VRTVLCVCVCDRFMSWLSSEGEQSEVWDDHSTSIGAQVDQCVVISCSLRKSKINNSEELLVFFPSVDRMTKEKSKRQTETKEER
jgi:hypothetical protein